MAQDDDVVLVSNGTYTLIGEIMLTNRVTVESLAGSLETILNANRVGRHFNISNSGAAVDGFTLTNGNTSIEGGGVRMVAGILRDCEIARNNVASGSGGGLYILGGTAVNCRVALNTAPSWAVNGGGIYAGGNALVADCVIVSNGPTHSSGGIYAVQTALVENCFIAWNRANFGGGGAELNSAAALLRRCIVRNNVVGQSSQTSYREGGGVALRAGTAESCLVVENETPTRGGGMYLWNSARAVNCTVVGNRAGEPWGAGLFNNGYVSNCIVYYNSQSDLYRYCHRRTALNIYAAMGTIYYTCTTPTVAGTGNITNQPEFVDRANGDFRLLTGSQCIDTGFDIGGAFTNDLTGAMRPTDGNGDGISRTDMGAYEAESATGGSFRCGFTIAPTDGLTNLTAFFAAHVAGSVTNLAWCGWDFDNDGLYETGGPGAVAVAHVFDQPGLYTVGFLASNTAMDSATLVRTACVYVAAKTICVATNGSETPPWDTFDKGLRTIAQGLDAGLAIGDERCTILVSNGVYRVGLGMTMIDNLELRSLSGRDQTAIDGQSLYRGMYLNTGMVHGFTFKYCVDDANFQKGAGVLMAGPALVSNCQFSFNVSRSYDGGGVWMGHPGAVLANSIVVSNRCQRWGGGVAIESSGPNLRNCLIAWNQSPQSGGGISVYNAKPRLLNCTIFGNSATNSGGGIWYDQVGAQVGLTNCIVESNTAPVGPHIYGVSGQFAPGYSCAPSLTNGVAGNITNPPAFRNPSAGDLRLTRGSPCFNAGTNLGEAVGDRDLDGNPRVVNFTVDMGAYELANIHGNTVVIR